MTEHDDNMKFIREQILKTMSIPPEYRESDSNKSGLSDAIRSFRKYMSRVKAESSDKEDTRIPPEEFHIKVDPAVKEDKQTEWKNWREEAATFIFDDISFEPALDPDMEVAIIYQCERCQSNPPIIRKILGRGLDGSTKLCKYCEQALRAFIIKRRGLLNFGRSGYRVEIIDNRSAK